MRVDRVLKEAARDFVSRRNRLTVLANRYGSDKGDRHFDRHNYTRIYDALFRGRRHEALRVAELGLLHNRDRSSWRRRDQRYAGTAAGFRAPSLQMWSDYFPNAEIFGFDINDFSAVRMPRCSIIRGDMGSRDDLSRFLEVTGGNFDVVIEDASHASHHQQIALGFLFSQVRPGGLYVVEDLHWQPGEIEEADAAKTVDVLRRAAITGLFRSPYMLPHEGEALARDVESIRLYDSASPDRALEGNDALAVIRKRSQAEAVSA
jgi:hypothetical protein